MIKIIDIVFYGIVEIFKGILFVLKKPTEPYIFDENYSIDRELLEYWQKDN